MNVLAGPWPKAVRPWHLSAALTAAALACFVGSLAGTIIMVFTQTGLQAPASYAQAPRDRDIHPDRLATLQQAATWTGEPPPVSITFRVPHDAGERIPAKLADIGNRRGWLFSYNDKVSTVALPASDLQLFGQAATLPDETLSELEETPLAGPSSPIVNARIDWEWESSTMANATLAAMLPSILAALALGAITLSLHTGTKPPASPGEGK